MNIKWIGANANNYTEGRQGKTIDKIVCHWIVGTLASADATFKKPDRAASAHYGVGPKEIHQYVKEEDTAWHAGNWPVNQTSIGIEHEGGPDIPIKEETYKRSAELIADICKRYNIPLDRQHIRAHKEFKATSCPGDLDLNKLINLARGGDNIVFTPQTKIPIGKVGSGEYAKDYGEVELQALQSNLGDFNRDNGELTKRVATLEKETNQQGFKNRIASLFYQLALAFESKAE